MNTNKIDALAAMDAAIARNLERGAAKGSPSDKDMREARAAVAELVAAAQDFAWVIDNAYDVTLTAPARARLGAALARVGGAK